MWHYTYWGLFTFLSCILFLSCVSTDTERYTWWWGSCIASGPVLFILSPTGRSLAGFPPSVLQTVLQQYSYAYFLVSSNNSSGRISRSGIACSQDVHIFYFSRCWQPISTVTGWITHPTCPPWQSSKGHSPYVLASTALLLLLVTCFFFVKIASPCCSNVDSGAISEAESLFTDMDSHISSVSWLLLLSYWFLQALHLLCTPLSCLLYALKSQTFDKI